MGIFPNAYYNYLKQAKASYYARKNEICRKIKDIYHEFGGILGYRSMRIFLARNVTADSQAFSNLWYCLFAAVTHSNSPFFKSFIILFCVPDIVISSFFCYVLSYPLAHYFDTDPIYFLLGKTFENHQGFLDVSKMFK